MTTLTPSPTGTRLEALLAGLGLFFVAAANGDFVITGSVVYRASVLPGDTATLKYSSLGTMQITYASAP